MRCRDTCRCFNPPPPFIESESVAFVSPVVSDMEPPMELSNHECWQPGNLPDSKSITFVTGVPRRVGTDPVAWS